MPPTWTKELPLNGGHVLDLALLAPAAHAGLGVQRGNANPLYWRPNKEEPTENLKHPSQYCLQSTTRLTEEPDVQA